MSNARIMIVEDRESISMAIKEMLTAYGKEIVGVATNGREALEIFSRTSPNVVLMDLILPDMSGFDVTSRIIEMSPDTKVLAISAMAESDTRERAMEAGCIDLLVKPFRMKELIDRIDDLVD